MPCNTKAFLSKMGIEMTGVDYQEVTKVDSSFGGGEKVDIYDPNLTFEEAIINFARRHGVPNKDFSSQNPDVIGNATHIDLVDYEPKNSMLDAGMEVATKIETAIQNTNHPSQENISYAKGVEENVIGFGTCVDGGMELTKQEMDALNKKGFNIGTAEDVVSKHKKRENKKFVGTLAKDAAKVGLVVQLFLNTGCTPRNITPSPAEITPTESPIVETTDLPTAIAIEIPTDVPAGSIETQSPTEATVRQPVTAEDVKNVEPSLELGINESGDLTGLPENTSEDMTKAVRSFYNAIAEKFPSSTIYFDQDTGGSGQWILYAISPSGNLIHQVVSYGGGAEQYADYPFAFDRNEQTGEWDVIGNYVEINTSGSTVGVIWRGLPQFLKDRINLSGNDSIYTKFMEYNRFSYQDPWNDVSDLKQYLEQSIPTMPAVELILNAPDTFYDENGLHITLSDSSRVIDVETADIENQVIFDEEYNLYKIFDAEGRVTAEYDPGQGVEGDVDYVPATGWVDIQKLAKDLRCHSEKGCFIEASNTPVTEGVNVQLSSTGVFRYTNAFDKDTEKVIGSLLVTQIATKTSEGIPAVSWVLVEAEDSLVPEVNAYKPSLSVVFYRLNGRLTEDDNNEAMKIHGIQDWQKWLVKGKMWNLQFSQDGYIYPYYNDKFISKTQIMGNQNISQSRDFLNELSSASNNSCILLLLSSASLMH